jgi:uncharacterized protein YndB with AHSA1/START domain
MITVRPARKHVGFYHPGAFWTGRVINNEVMSGAKFSSTSNSRLIRASGDVIYRAFVDPGALAVWLCPGEMTARVHEFDGRVGGGYKMSLFYPASEQAARGKSAESEDRFTARFVEMVPGKKVVEAIRFDSADPAYSQEMTMVVTLEDKAGQTEVTIAFENIPPGIRPEDNEAGTRSSLEKLARYVEGQRE